jgi:hypothetical protein
VTARIDGTPLAANARERPPGRLGVVGARAASRCRLLASLGTSVANGALPTARAHVRRSFQAIQVGVARLPPRPSRRSWSAWGGSATCSGRRRLLLAGISVFTGAVDPVRLAPSLWALIAARAAQGLGAAVMMALTMAFVSETVPKASAGSAMGLLGAMSAVGHRARPIGRRRLAGRPGLAGAVPCQRAPGRVALLLAYRHLPADPRSAPPKRSSFDGAGTLLLAATLGAYALAMTVGAAASAR